MAFSTGIDLGTFHTCAVAYQDELFVPRTESLPSLAVKRPRGDRWEILVGDEAQRGWTQGARALVAPKLALVSAPATASVDYEKEELHDVLRKLSDAAVKRLRDEMGRAGSRASPARGRLVLTVPPGWSIADRQELLRVVGNDAEFLHEPVALYLGLWECQRRRPVAGPISKLSTAEQALIVDWGAGTVDIACVNVTRSTAGAWTFQSIHRRDLTIQEVAGARLVGDALVDVKPDIDRMTTFRVQQALAAGSVDRPLDDRLANLLDSRDRVTAFRQRLVAREEAAARTVARRIKELGEWPNNARSIVVLYGGPLESENLRARLMAELEAGSGIEPSRFVHASAALCAGFDMRRDQAVAMGAAVYGKLGHPMAEYDYRILYGGTEAPLSMDPTSTRRVPLKPMTTPPTDVPVEIQQGYGGGNWGIPFEMRQKHTVSVPLRSPGGFVGVTYERAANGLNVQLMEVDRKFDPMPGAKPIPVPIPEASTRFRVDGTASDN